MMMWFQFFYTWILQSTGKFSFLYSFLLYEFIVKTFYAFVIKCFPIFSQYCSIPEKNQAGGGVETLFFKTLSRIFMFFTLPLENPEKTNLHP